MNYQQLMKLLVRKTGLYIYLLASLPESYNVLVTALEANTDVPSLAVVREWLLHEESKMKNKPSHEEALAVSFKKKLRCHL